MKLSSWLNTAQLVSAQGHSGAMVALVAPPEVGTKLAKLGWLKAPGVDPDNLHVTLAFLGKASSIDRRQRQRITKALKDVASRHDPVDIRIGGHGKFLAGPDGTPLIATIDSPGLNLIQSDIEATLRDFMAIPSDHGWTPHLTLGYLPAGSDYELPWLPPETKLPTWKADTIELVMADESVDRIKLGTPDDGEYKRTGAAKQWLVDFKYRPGLVVVFRGNPNWQKGQDLGWWFTADPMPSDAVDIFKDLSAQHRSRGEAHARFFPWRENGLAGWWTLNGHSAMVAHEALEFKGYDLDYINRMPFQREYQWEEKLPHTQRWEGDYDVVLRGVAVLLAYPDLDDTDRKWITSYWKDLVHNKWLNEAQIENLKKIMRRPRNLKWLRLKGYTRKNRDRYMSFEDINRFATSTTEEVRGQNVLATVHDEVGAWPIEAAEDKPCPKGKVEGPQNRCVSEEQLTNIKRQRKRKRKRLSQERERDEEQLKQDHERKREQLSDRQQRQRTRTQISGGEGSQAGPWDSHHPYAGAPPRERAPGAKESEQELDDEGHKLTGGTDGNR